MKKLLLYFSYGIYLFFILGFLLHTSSNPVIFGKYSLKYAGFLLIIILLFLPYRKIVTFLLPESSINLGDGKVFRFTPLRKFIFYFVLFSFCVLFFEVFLRFRHQEGLDNHMNGFHPFLQNKLDVHDEDLHINVHGFRGDNISKKKPKDTFRVFVLGGSTVLCDRVPFEKSHVRILEKLLKQHYSEKKLEVLNVGNHWHTSEHSLIKYLFKIKDFNPDLIVIWHGLNDLYRSFTPKSFGYGEFQSDYSHFYGPSSRMVFNYSKALKPDVIKINLFLLKRLRDYNLLFSDLRETNKSPVDVYEFPSLKSFIRNMVSFVNTMKVDNVRLVLATQPFLYNDKLNDEELDSIWFPQAFCLIGGKKYPNINSMILGMNLFNAEIKNIAKEYNVSLIDLEAKIPKRDKYFLDDCHYTEKGNALVAKIIFEFLVNNKLLE